MVGRTHMSTWWRRLLKRLHPKGIPWPGTVLYNAVSGTGIFRRHYELVAEDVARYGQAGAILDIGTGPGRLLLALREAFRHAVLVGVDISPSMAAQARRNIERDGGAGGIEVGAASAYGLPFPDGTFERVISTGSLHHWEAPLAGLAEAHRVLRAGGYNLIYDLVRHMPEPVARDVRARFGGFRLALLWLHSFEEPFLNADEMEALGKQTDFVVEGTRFVGALCCLVLRKPTASAACRTAHGPCKPHPRCPFRARPRSRIPRGDSLCQWSPRPSEHPSRS
jgi:ubiquinone/menaquinone biosynthesis C-methylase UbiE